MLEELLKQKQAQLAKNGWIDFTESELKNLTTAQAVWISTEFHGHCLMKLPENEIRFFEWLKKNDPAVWKDLWEEDDQYLVSIDFLSSMTADGNGFPICDLESNDNFWFSERHLKPKGRQIFQVIEQKLKNNQKLSVEETLLFEIASGAIDIWHFCYRYQVPVSLVKQKVEILKLEDVLVHLTNREDLVKYIDF